VNGKRVRALRFLPSQVAGSPGIGFELDATGRMQDLDHAASVRQAILLLLATRPGERIMRPEYGCDLFRVAFQPNDATTAGLAIHYVRRAIERFEPRVDVVRIDADPHPDDPSLLLVDVQVRVLATGEVQDITHQVSLTEEAG